MTPEPGDVYRRREPREHRPDDNVVRVLRVERGSVEVGTTLRERMELHSVPWIVVETRAGRYLQFHETLFLATFEPDPNQSWGTSRW